MAVPDAPARAVRLSVDVGLGDIGQVVVEDMGDLIDIDPARGDIRGDQNGHWPVLKAPSARVRAFWSCSVNRSGDVGLAQYLHQSICTMLGSSEDQGSPLGIPFQKSRDQGGLAILGNHVDRLLNQFSRGSDGIDLDEFRFMQDGVGQFPYLAGHRCREQKGLSLDGKSFDDFSNVVDESHVEHSIGLVENEKLD